MKLMQVFLVEFDLEVFDVDDKFYSLYNWEKVFKCVLRAHVDNL